MNLFDKLVLPQSSDHIQLLHYIAVIVLVLGIPYLALLLGSTILSYRLKKKGVEDQSNLYNGFASSSINLATATKSLGIILGIMPVFLTLIIYTQLFSGLNIIGISLLALAFIFITVGISSSYVFKYSFNYKSLFKNAASSGVVEVTEALDKLGIASSKSAKLAITFLLLGTYCFVAGITNVTSISNWGLSTIYALFHWQVLLHYLEFILISSLMTGSTILFSNYYWEGGKQLEEGFSELVKTISWRISFYAAIILPLIVLLEVLSLPQNALSESIFIFAGLAILFLLFIMIVLYSIFNEKNYKRAGILFFFVIFTQLFLVVKDQLATSNVGQMNMVVLSAKFDDYLKSMKGDEGEAVINGKEVYEVRCSSCHKFDVKLVGPPYKETMPKYEGKEEQLVQFILNPVKKNPAYPPMPNPGLKPAEAKAVAKYILGNYKK